VLGFLDDTPGGRARTKWPICPCSAGSTGSRGAPRRRGRARRRRAAVPRRGPRAPRRARGTVGHDRAPDGAPRAPHARSNRVHRVPERGVPQLRRPRRPRCDRQLRRHGRPRRAVGERPASWRPGCTSPATSPSAPADVGIGATVIQGLTVGEGRSSVPARSSSATSPATPPSSASPRGRSRGGLVTRPTAARTECPTTG
jgi:hypothetical protein